MPPALVIFDLDGTLVDSGADIALHLGDALVAHGLVRPADDDVRAWIGHGARQLCERAVAEAHAAPALATDVLASLRARYAERPVVTTALYPGIAGLLDELAAARIPIAILSNKPMDLTLAVAAALLTRWPWVAIVGEQPPMPAKPDPTAALAIAAARGVSPGATIFVGDSEVDVACAVAAGMRPVAVTWGLRTRGALARACAEAPAAEVVQDARQLRALLVA